jgi:hypothetical protein
MFLSLRTRWLSAPWQIGNPFVSESAKTARRYAAPSLAMLAYFDRRWVAVAIRAE